MQELKIKIKRVMITTGRQDEIHITPDEAEGQTAYPICGYETTIKIRTQAGYAAKYCQLIGLVPDEIIEV